MARYESGAPFRCLACTAIARSKRSYVREAQAADATDAVEGAYWVAELIPRGLARAAP